jgi:hypothetical protein
MPPFLSFNICRNAGPEVWKDVAVDMSSCCLIIFQLNCQHSEISKCVGLANKNAESKVINNDLTVQYGTYIKTRSKKTATTPTTCHHTHS